MPLPAGTNQFADYFFITSIPAGELVPHLRPFSGPSLTLDQISDATAVTTTTTTTTTPLKPPPPPHSSTPPPPLLDPTTSRLLSNFQNVIDNFDQERDRARENVIKLPPKNPDGKSPKRSTLTEAGALSSSSARLDLKRGAVLQRNSSLIRPLRIPTFSGKDDESLSAENTLEIWNGENTVDGRNTRNSIEILGENRARALEDESSIHLSDPPQSPAKSIHDIPLPLKAVTADPAAPIKSPNILEVVYTTQPFYRYPATDYSPKEAFPDYITNFCFPHDAILQYGDTTPTSTYHTFVITDQDGSRRYGTCLIFYERIPEENLAAVSNWMTEWIKHNITEDEREFGYHTNEKLLQEQAILQDAQSRFDVYTSSTTGRLNAIFNTAERMSVEDEIHNSQMKIALYEQLLHPVRPIFWEASKLWVPKCVGLLSKWQWADVLVDWLRVLVDDVRRGKYFDQTYIERALGNLIHQVPVPPPGEYEIAITIGDVLIHCSRPAVNQIPTLKSFSLYPLFRCLSSYNILKILEVLLYEGKVVFVSDHLAMLTLAAESMQRLLYPFYWPFVYIPVLPSRLLTCLESPVPYILGVGRQYWDPEEYVEDACIVDLDRNTLQMNSPMGQTLPSKNRKKLLAAMDQFASIHSHHGVPYGVPLYIQMAYPRGRLTLTCNKSKITHAHHQLEYQNKLARSSESSLDTASPNSSRPVTPISNLHLDTLGKRVAAHVPTSDQSKKSFLSSNPQPLSYIPEGSYEQSSSSSPPRHSTEGGRRSSAPTAKELRDNGKKSDSDTASLRSEFSASTISYGWKNFINSIQSKGDRSSRGFFASSRASNRERWSWTGIPSHSSKSTDTHETTNDILGSTFTHGPEKVMQIEGHVLVEMKYFDALADHTIHECGVCGEDFHDTGDISRKVTICDECHLVTHIHCAHNIMYPCLPRSFDENSLQDAFLRCFAGLMANYRECMMSAEYAHENGFNVSEEHSALRAGREIAFAKDRFLGGAAKEVKPFLSVFVDSQMFTQFIQDRLELPPNEHEVLFFDEIIKRKTNRSVMKLNKEATLFLDDFSYHIRETILAPKPDEVHINDTASEKEDISEMNLPFPYPFPSKLRSELIEQAFNT